MCLAVPGRICRIDAAPGESALARSGLVDFGGVQRVVSLAFVPDAEPGDQVLVHAGVAIQKLDSAAADRLHALWSEVEDRS